MTNREIRELVEDARGHIKAQSDLLVAYRTGITPERALDELTRLHDVPTRLDAALKSLSGDVYNLSPEDQREESRQCLGYDPGPTPVSECADGLPHDEESQVRSEQDLNFLSYWRSPGVQDVFFGAGMMIPKWALSLAAHAWAHGRHHGRGDTVQDAQAATLSPDSFQPRDLLDDSGHLRVSLPWERPNQPVIEQESSDKPQSEGADSP